MRSVSSRDGWSRDLTRELIAPLAVDLAADELLDLLAGLVVAVLLGRRLHEVRRRRQDRTADAAVLGDHRGTYRVDDHASGVRRVPDLKLVFQAQRRVAERLALQPDVGPLAVIQPRHVVGRTDMHVGLGHLVRDLRGDRLGLGNLLGLQALALQHVHEVHVAAEVQLIGPQQLDPAILEQLGQHPVRNGGANLGLDVVTDDRDASAGELLRPDRVGGNEDRQRVDERDLGVNRALRVELVGIVRADRQVRHQHVSPGVLEHLHDVDRVIVGLGDDLAVVLAEAVAGLAALHGHARRRYVADGNRVVLARHNGLGQIATDLLGVDVERGNELNVPDVVRAELDVHQARHPARRVGVLVVLHALDEGTCAVPDPHNGYAYRTHEDLLLFYFILSAGQNQPVRPDRQHRFWWRRRARRTLRPLLARRRSAHSASGLHARLTQGHDVAVRGCSCRPAPWSWRDQRGMTRPAPQAGCACPPGFAAGRRPG